MDVVGKAVVAGEPGDDGLDPDGGGGHLESVNPAPGVTEKAHASVAPGSTAQPLHDLHPVLPLLVRVLVAEDPVRVPRASDVSPDRHVPVRGQPGVAEVVAFAGKVRLTVG